MEREYTHRKHPFVKGLKIFGWVILGTIGAAGLAFIFGYFVMMLWNWLMPELFSLATITFWQAAGIVLLARLIFGGFKHGSDHSKKHSPKSKFFHHWKTDGNIKGRCGDWRHFDNYWDSEGELAYNNYLDRKKEQEQK